MPLDALIQKVKSGSPLSQTETTELMTLLVSQFEALKKRDSKKYAALLRQVNQIAADLNSELKAILTP